VAVAAGADARIDFARMAGGGERDAGREGQGENEAGQAKGHLKGSVWIVPNANANSARRAAHVALREAAGVMIG
jgi:hypothetical protein